MNEPRTEARQVIADLLAQAVDDGLYFEDKRLEWADTILAVASPAPDRGLRDALEAIRDYEPKEVVKDDFAYDRMVESYRSAARAALEATPRRPEVDAVVETARGLIDQLATKYREEVDFEPLSRALAILEAEGSHEGR